MGRSNGTDKEAKNNTDVKKAKQTAVPPKKIQRNILAITPVAGGARSFPLLGLFANEIDNPYYVKHSAVTAKIDAKQHLLGIDGSAERTEELKKFEGVNAEIDTVREKQLRYVLTEICKKTNRNVSLVDEYMKEKPTAKSFIAKVNEIKVIVQPDKNSQILTAGGASDPEKADSLKESKGELSVDDINRILIESSSVEAVGKPTEEHVNLMRGELASAKAQSDYEEVIGDSMILAAGDPRNSQQLKEKLNSCLHGSPAEIDYNELAERKKEFLREKMSALPEEKRTEAAFTEECEKFDFVMHAYYSSEKKVEVDARKAYSVPKAEFEKLALESIPPTTIAREVETYFNASVSKEKAGNAPDYRLAVSYIQHLEEIHSKRSFMTRFVDFFKHGGENSTINRMKNTLYREMGSKEAVNTMLQSDTTRSLYDKPSYTKQLASLSEKKVPVYSEYDATMADIACERIDQLLVEENLLKDQINATQKEKQAEEAMFSNFSNQQKTTSAKNVKDFEGRTKENAEAAK